MKYSIYSNDEPLFPVSISGPRPLVGDILTIDGIKHKVLLVEHLIDYDRIEADVRVHITRFPG